MQKNDSFMNHDACVKKKGGGGLRGVLWWSKTPIFSYFHFQFYIATMEYTEILSDYKCLEKSSSSLLVLKWQKIVFTNEKEFRIMNSCIMCIIQSEACV